MLGSLVALPTAALFWPSFPTAVDSVLASVNSQYAGRRAGDDDPAARRQLPEAPRFEPCEPRGPLDFAQSQRPSRETSEAAPATSAPAFAGNPFAAAPQLEVEAQNLPSSGMRPETSVAGKSSASWSGPPTPSGAPSHVAQVSHIEPSAASSRSSAQRLAPTGAHPTSMREASTPTSAGEQVRALGEAPAFGTDALSSIQAELRRRGVTYSLLESWEADQFRFHCRMAVAGNARYTQQFEAIDADPLSAMRQVLRQIDAWQSGRSF